MRISTNFVEPYSHAKSPQKFTQSQMPTILVLKAERIRTSNLRLRSRTPRSEEMPNNLDQLSSYGNQPDSQAVVSCRELLRGNTVIQERRVAKTVYHLSLDCGERPVPALP
jgi:hypothetical protein